MEGLLAPLSMHGLSALSERAERCECGAARKDAPYSVLVVNEESSHAERIRSGEDSEGMSPAGTARYHVHFRKKRHSHSDAVYLSKTQRTVF